MKGRYTQKKLMMDADIDIEEHKQAKLSQDELLKKLDNINKEQTEFIAIVLHDLKGPLRGIEALANWILSECDDKLGNQANEKMDLILEHVKRMYNLIDDALQYSRAGHVEEKRKQVNLNNFVPEIIDTIILPKNITVTIENELPVIECEEVHFIQIFHNLLSNAIKYIDKPQGWIKIGCVEKDGFWRFRIADNGPGIEKKHFKKTFEISHGFPSSHYFTGSGLGLAMTKKIVEVYNGKIWVESEVGEGSSFVFTLPK